MPDPFRPGPSRRRGSLWLGVRDALTAYLPLLLMLLLALGSWWLVKMTPMGKPVAAARPAGGEPDYTVRGVQLERFAAGGALELTLQGRQMRHFPEEDRLEVEALELQAQDARGSRVLATARQAVADGSATRLKLLGGANLVAEQAAGRTLRVSSETLTLDRRSALVVSTDRPVWLQMTGQQVRAGGLLWQHDQGLLTLLPPLRASLSALNPVTPSADPAR